MSRELRASASGRRSNVRVELASEADAFDHARGDSESFSEACGAVRTRGARRVHRCKAALHGSAERHDKAIDRGAGRRRACRASGRWLCARNAGDDLGVKSGRWNLGSGVPIEHPRALGKRYVPSPIPCTLLASVASHDSLLTPHAHPQHRARARVRGKQPVRLVIVDAPRVAIRQLHRQVEPLGNEAPPPGIDKVHGRRGWCGCGRPRRRRLGRRWWRVARNADQPCADQAQSCDRQQSRSWMAHVAVVGRHAGNVKPVVADRSGWPAARTARLRRRARPERSRTRPHG